MYWKDPIIEEIHLVRCRHNAQFKEDWAARYEDWKRKEKYYEAQGFRLLDLPVKREMKKAA